RQCNSLVVSSNIQIRTQWTSRVRAPISATVSIARGSSADALRLVRTRLSRLCSYFESSTLVSSAGSVLGRVAYVIRGAPRGMRSVRDQPQHGESCCDE